MADIRLTWLGHSCFLAEAENYRIVFDPFEDGYIPGIDAIKVNAHEVICSHNHHDHGAEQVIERIFDKTNNPFSVRRIDSFHDEQNGELRGCNTMTILQLGEIRIAHLGDIGCMPTKEQLEELKGLDAVLLPVGGFYTMEPELCAKLLAVIEPKVVIPMHYRSDSFGFDTIKELDEILHLEEYQRLGYGVVDYKDNTISITNEMKKQTAVLEYHGGVA